MRANFPVGFSWKIEDPLVTELSVCSAPTFSTYRNQNEHLNLREVREGPSVELKMSHLNRVYAEHHAEEANILVLFAP